MAPLPEIFGYQLLLVILAASHEKDIAELQVDFITWLYLNQVNGKPVPAGSLDQGQDITAVSVEVQMLGIKMANSDFGHQEASQNGRPNPIALIIRRISSIAV
jgi:hypothetical protein